MVERNPNGSGSSSSSSDKKGGDSDGKKKGGFVSNYLKPIANNFGMGLGKKDTHGKSAMIERDDAPAIYEVTRQC